jgi:hypothetical protein
MLEVEKLVCLRAVGMQKIPYFIRIFNHCRQRGRRESVDMKTGKQVSYTSDFMRE